MKPTKVIFRRYKGTSDVIALFTQTPASPNPVYCESYMHLGQHGAADPQGTINLTVPAKPDEYSSLEAELLRIGYKLKISKRNTYGDLQARREALEEYK